jgi:hypothetical protein
MREQRKLYQLLRYIGAGTKKKPLGEDYIWQEYMKLDRGGKLYNFLSGVPTLEHTISLIYYN